MIDKRTKCDANAIKRRRFLQAIAVTGLTPGSANGTEGRYGGPEANAWRARRRRRRTRAAEDRHARASDQNRRAILPHQNALGRRSAQRRGTQDQAPFSALSIYDCGV